MKILFATVACLALCSIEASTSAQPESAPSIAANMKIPPGYLARADLPDSLTLLPPPPAARSASFARDEEAHAAAIALNGTSRWALATSDADLHFPHAPGAFSCAAGLTISSETTPRLYSLLGRMLVDVGLSTYRAKDQYKRTRPFVVHNEGTCTPADDALLRADGSYPSGHSAIGWGWALVLTEVVPSKANAILQRGRDFGQSRVVCNAHWQSDVDGGRIMAAATVALLHSDATFAGDLQAAKAEVAKVARSAPAPQVCAAEAAALASAP